MKKYLQVAVIEMFDNSDCCCLIFLLPYEFGNNHIYQAEGVI